MDIPAEPTRGSNDDRDSPLVVLLRVTYPNIIYNVVATADRTFTYDGAAPQSWHVTGVKGSWMWESLLEKALPDQRTPLCVQAFQVAGWTFS